MTAEDRIPVLIGAGEVTDRVADPALAREPAELMAEALRRAAADAGAPDLLARLDSLDIVSSVSWPYPDLPGAVAARLPRAPARLVLGPHRPRRERGGRRGGGRGAARRRRGAQGGVRFALDAAAPGRLRAAPAGLPLPARGEDRRR